MHLTKDQIDEVLQELAKRSIKDSQFPLADDIKDSDTVVVVRNGSNIQIPLGHILAALKLDVRIVDVLPTASEDTMQCIYLVPSTNPKAENVKDEYITIRNGEEGAYTYAWEQIGSTEIDLSEYAKKSEVVFKRGTAGTAIASKTGGNIASGTESFAVGYDNQARGNDSSAMGGGTTAVGLESHAEGGGERTDSSYTVSGSAGSLTYTTSAAHNLKVGFVVAYNGVYAAVTAANILTFTLDKTLDGENALVGATIKLCSNVAYGSFSHVEGRRTKATGSGAHAEGGATRAHGDYAHAEGFQAFASGESAHAEGKYTEAPGEAAHAEGAYGTASGKYSHVEGTRTRAVNQGEHAEGNYNIPIEGKSIHTVGIGTQGTSADKYKNAKNANLIDKDGKHYILGIGGFTGLEKTTQELSSRSDLSTVLNSKGTYSKPQDGIPKTHLASGVQSSLDKADTALQPVQDVSLQTGAVHTSGSSIDDDASLDAQGVHIYDENGDTHYKRGKIVNDSEEISLPTESGILVIADGMRKIVILTQQQYNNLGTYEPLTEYHII